MPARASPTRQPRLCAPEERKGSSHDVAQQIDVCIRDWVLAEEIMSHQADSPSLQIAWTFLCPKLPSFDHSSLTVLNHEAQYRMGPSHLQCKAPYDMRGVPRSVMWD